MTIANPLMSSTATAPQTHGKKRANTRCHSASRVGGSSGPVLGRSTRMAKNMPPTQITAATMWNATPIISIVDLLYGAGLAGVAREGDI